MSEWLKLQDDLMESNPCFQSYRRKLMHSTNQNYSILQTRSPWERGEERRIVSLSSISIHLPSYMLPNSSRCSQVRTISPCLPTIWNNLSIHMPPSLSLPPIHPYTFYEFWMMFFTVLGSIEYLYLLIYLYFYIVLHFSSIRLHANRVLEHVYGDPYLSNPHIK